MAGEAGGVGGGDGGGEGGGGEGGGGEGGGGGHGRRCAERRVAREEEERPVQPAVLDVTLKVASTYPCCERKKSCTPLLAWLSVSVWIGRVVGGRAGNRRRKRLGVSSTATTDVTVLPEAALPMGVLK